MTIESPEQVARRSIQNVRASMARAGVLRLRYAINLNGVRLSLTARPSAPTRDDTFAGPDQLRLARPATRTVFTLVATLRAECGPDGSVWPADIAARWDRDEPDTDHSIDTINHALADLRKRKAARSHRDRGWYPEAEQGALFPNPPRDADRKATAAELRAARAEAKHNPRIWVPGERASGGVALVDVKSEETVFVESTAVGDVGVPNWKGELHYRPAVRGEVLEVDGKIATVRFPSGAKVQTRLLGDWQLDGLTSPETDA